MSGDVFLIGSETQPGTANILWRVMKMAAGAEGRANMVFTEVTIGPLGGLRDVVRLVPELLSAHVALLLEVAGLEIPISG